MKALVVDDSRMIRRIVRKALELLGFTSDDVLEAGDGKEAMAAVSNSGDSLRVVLLDWNLPELDGISVLKEISSSPAEDKPSVVMVTSLADDADERQAMDCGASAYIKKPFTPKLLADKLRVVLCEAS